MNAMIARQANPRIFCFFSKKDRLPAPEPWARVLPTSKNIVIRCESMSNNVNADLINVLKQCCP